MRGSRKFYQKGSNTDNVFLVDETERGSKLPLKVDHHRPASKTPLAFRWCADIGPPLNACLLAL